MSNDSRGFVRLAVVLAMLIGTAVSLYIHFDSKESAVEEARKNLEKTESKKKTSISTGSISIKEVQLTPVNFDIPSSFFIEIENSGSKIAKDITLSVDFGVSEIEKCSFRPNENSNFSQRGDAYILKVQIKELIKNESFYINCHVSAPLFKKILLSASNISTDKQLTWTSFKEQRNNTSNTGGWAHLLEVLGKILAVFIFFGVLFRIMRRIVR